MVPQTFEDPSVNDPWSNVLGDGDPLDIVEIGSGKYLTGDVLLIKILGALQMIDKDEADWKIIGINIEDPLAQSFNDIEDVSETQKLEISQFQIFSAGPTNKTDVFGPLYFVNKAFAYQVIQDKYELWDLLNNGTTPRNFTSGVYMPQCTICTPNTKPEYRVTPAQALTIVQQSFNDYLNSN